jgi:hypothetical protein
MFIAKGLFSCPIYGVSSLYSLIEYQDCFYYILFFNKNWICLEISFSNFTMSVYFTFTNNEKFLFSVKLETAVLLVQGLEQSKNALLKREINVIYK